MKKILFLTLLSFLLYQSHVNAQCDIQNVTTNILSSVPSGGECNVTFNFTFQVDVNGGNKTIVFQAWDSISYPNYWANSTNSTKSPENLDLRKNGTGPLPFLNLAFNINGLTKYTTYEPDPSVPLNTNYTIIPGAIVGGYQTITLSNITVTVPSCSGITMLTDVWSSNSENTWGSHCLNFKNKYAFNYPLIRATQGCNTVNNENIRDYAFSVTNSNTSQNISYRYQIYRDSLVPQTNPRFGVYDETDVLVFSSTMDSVLSPNQVDTFPPSLYVHNSGQFINQRIFVVILVTGVENSVIQTCSQAGCAILPVTLKLFNANLINKDVILSWETADEINNKGFEIQRRLSGSNAYENIGFVEAKATPGLGASYSFSDPARNKGTISYRLAQVDHDGKKTFSDIRIVNTGSGKSQMIIYPNPSNGLARISLPIQSGKTDISLEDFTGKAIQRWNDYSANTLQINNVRPGIYLVRVRFQETGEQLIDRLIVQ